MPFGEESLMFCPVVGLVYFSSNPLGGTYFHHCVLNSVPANELCERAEVSWAMAISRKKTVNSVGTAA